MRNELNKLSEGPNFKLNTVLHLGAGTGRELEQYLRWNACKVVLVEANPALADQLRLKVLPTDRGEVIAAAAATMTGEIPFWIMNNLRDSSLCRPTGLMERYPNLNVTQQTVPAVSLGQLIEQLPLNTDPANLMVMEVQGAELALLLSVPAELLQKFSWIVVRASTDVLYEKGGSIVEVEAVLRSVGFLPVETSRYANGSLFQDNLFRRDDVQAELTSLRRLANDYQKTISSLRRSLDEQIKAADQHRANVEHLTQDHDAQLTQAAGREKQLNALAQEKADLAKAHADLVQEREALQQQVSQLSKARDEQSQVAAQRQGRIEALTQERDAQATLAAERKSELDSLQSRIRDKEARIAQLESHRAELETRQQLLNDDMLRAEAQIDLIKDVLLREQSL